MFIKSLFLMLALVFSAQTFAGGDDEAFRAWCDMTMKNLKQTQVKAQRESGLDNFGAAAKIYLDGLELPYRQFGKVNPITQRMINFAQDLGQEVIDVAEGDYRGTKAATVVLEAAYDMIIDTIIKVERPYYQTKCGYCSGKKTKQFEKDMLGTIERMLRTLNDEIVYVRRGTIYPVGPAQVYLKAAEITAGASKKHLANLIYAESYACEILSLDQVAYDLSDFNGQENDEYAKREKFEDTYAELNSIINQISGPSYNCWN